ncbi:type III pantothenate kinase [Pokkaliibacter sp. MBI-7]|uniref:type III pantothenate kinase n=1 Tax=Pokkaliibacter sp. MBI-7 TaxID=3040600 RepID=UPI0024472FBB|nr:type III pantothenate kinase [Pokkaliibacter sp. MBI-7]MDH2433866.1 type III pantothenate kinase [Pokkaliibacter sp. MBI-7]
MRFPQAEVDVGNTRIKWRVRYAMNRLGPVMYRPSADSAVVMEELQADGVRALALSSVGAPAAVQQWQQYAQECQWSLYLAASESSAAGVVNAYREPGRLGVDRWLAMVAARNAYPSDCLCVFNAGSALTVDFVAADGRHLGGYIVQGWAMLQQALLGNTQRIHVRAEMMSDTLPGDDTDSCVGHGRLLMWQGFIRQMIVQAESYSAVSRFVVAGGDADKVLPVLQGRLCVHCPDLVLDGLAIMARSAEC